MSDAALDLIDDLAGHLLHVLPAPAGAGVAGFDNAMRVDAHAPAARGKTPSRHRWWPLRAWVCLLTVAPLLRWGAVVHAVPAGQPWRRACPTCATPIGLGPAAIAAPLAPTARCRACGTRVGPPPYTAEVATLLTGAALVIAPLGGWELAAYAWWVAFALILSFVDLTVHRLPDRLVLACGGGFLVLLGPLAFTGHHGEWLRALSAGGALALVLGLAAVLPRSGLGLGDAKFAGAAGAAAGWVSWFAVMAVVFISFVALALVGTALIAARRARWSSHLAYGPFLAVATLVVVVALA